MFAVFSRQFHQFVLQSKMVSADILQSFLPYGLIRCAYTNLHKVCDQCVIASDFEIETEGFQEGSGRVNLDR